MHAALSGMGFYFCSLAQRKKVGSKETSIYTGQSRFQNGSIYTRPLGIEPKALENKEKAEAGNAVE